MSDPYNSTGRQYDAEVFCAVLSEMHNALIEPMWRILSQHIDDGYDPYNNQRPRVTLSSSPPHATRKS